MRSISTFGNFCSSGRVRTLQRCVVMSVTLALASSAFTVSRRSTLYNHAFCTTSREFSPLNFLSSRRKQAFRCQVRMFSIPNNSKFDSNKWTSQDNDKRDGEDWEDWEDWEDKLRQREDSSAWGQSFESLAGRNDDISADVAGNMNNETDADTSEDWISALQSITIDEVEFMKKENERADAARRMHDWGFRGEQIEAALGLATTDALEKDEGILDEFREVTAKSGFGMMLEDDVDLTAVESHTMVERHEETGDLTRSQMVYVDEHSCIGCTNCATTASATFFMEDYLGRARVFSQWGDDDETIKVAIQTCPVDCIHYVAYDELVNLEIERRDQNINPKARLIGQGEFGGGQGHRVGGPTSFTGPQAISGNMKARCANCPTAGCYNCPMYGVGKNPEFERCENLRKKMREEQMRKFAMESANKSIDL